MDSGYVRCYGKAIRNGKKVVCPHIEFCARYANPVTNPYFEFMASVPFRKYTCREYRKKLDMEDQARIATLSDLKAEAKAKAEAKKNAKNNKNKKLVKTKKKIKHGK